MSLRLDGRVQHVRLDVRRLLGELPSVLDRFENPLDHHLVGARMRGGSWTTGVAFRREVAARLMSVE